MNHFWIEGVLKHSLLTDTYLEIDKVNLEEVSNTSFKDIIEIPQKEKKIYSQNSSVIDIFNKEGRLLLILGAAGAGKTFTLLQLAKELIACAQQDPTLPIPVILNLTSWANERTSIFEWIVNELSLRNLSPKRNTRKWLKNHRLLMLLDGLDEVKTEFRLMCVKEINIFMRDYGLSGLVVSCRQEEYISLTKKLNVPAALCLQPLTTNHVKIYLAKNAEKFNGLERVFNQDLILQELAKTPLMVSVMCLAYQGLTYEDLTERDFESISERRKHLFETFIKRMFDRKPALIQAISKDIILRELYWIAFQMQKNNQSEFYLEMLQPTWLSNNWQLAMYTIVVSILPAFIIGGAIFLFYAMQGAFVLATILGCFCALIGGVLAHFGNMFFAAKSSQLDVSVVEKLTWSWKGAAKGLERGIASPFNSRERITLGFFFAALLSPVKLLESFVFGYLFCIREGLVSVPVDKAKRLKLNQGIHNSLRNAAFVSITVGFAPSIILFNSIAFVTGASWMSDLSLIVAYFATFTFGFWYGGLAVIQHYTLRLITFLSRKSPLNYRRFFEKTIALVFLQRVGGGVTFLHRTFLEYFAYQYKQK
ncbi:NACHT domain-containing protein [Xanthocytophaga agilis]|uniref:NACHT domain-containing protein n=1 Tax=Xanthocytophaga agilis TaxID=3048010 RepID=A0AAE3R7Y1_9BACT|nr:NACHT domain-containing protein [Xanthocytophaga agilis]MDJ1505511.1 NACHT domain-containing protein [Xanthocytophaga agilis]